MPTLAGDFIQGQVVCPTIFDSFRTAPKYTNGQIVIVTATPDPGLSFIGWFNSVTNASNPLNLTTDGSKSLVALSGLPLGQSLDASGFGRRAETNEPSQTVWWSGTAPSSGQGRLSFSSTNFSSALSVGVYTGNSVSALTQVGIGCAGSVFTNGGFAYDGEALFTITAGAIYQIALGGGSGNFDFNIQVAAGWTRFSMQAANLTLVPRRFSATAIFNSP